MMIPKVITLLCIVVTIQSYAISEQKVTKLIKVHKDESHKNEHQDAHVMSYPWYEFSYKVKDLKTHDIKGQHESRHGKHVKGEYWLVEPDGGKRIVKYHTDKHGGFRAKVERNPAQEKRIEKQEYSMLIHHEEKHRSKGESQSNEGGLNEGNQEGGQNESTQEENQRENNQEGGEQSEGQGGEQGTAEGGEQGGVQGSEQGRENGGDANQGGEEAQGGQEGEAQGGEQAAEQGGEDGGEQRGSGGEQGGDGGSAEGNEDGDGGDGSDRDDGGNQKGKGKDHKKIYKVHKHEYHIVIHHEHHHHHKHHKPESKGKEEQSQNDQVQEERKGEQTKGVPVIRYNIHNKKQYPVQIPILQHYKSMQESPKRIYVQKSKNRFNREPLNLKA